MRETLVLLILAILSPLVLPAEVADSSASGFTVRTAVLVYAAGPEVVYDRLVHHVGDWWDPEHTFSNDAHNLSIDDKPMGCFCEKLPNHGGVRHAEVVMVMPNKMLVMSGAIGPLQKFALTGTMTIVLKPLHKDTRVELIYTVGGYTPDGLTTWAPTVDKVLEGQMNRLKAYVETGNPVPAAVTKQP